MKVGFVGLGHEGAPMSRHILAAGHDTGGEMLPIRLIEDLTGTLLRIEAPSVDQTIG
jgi:3-hydroxyisobutyrate dehydrogenase-like beta-hydroxyacid dehydrogenase